MNENIFILHHTYEYGNKMENEEVKLLGVYSSKQQAEQAIKRYENLTGFCDHSTDCFSISCYKIDKDTGWTDGFVGNDEIARDFEILTSCFNKWLGISGEAADAWEDNNYYNALSEINKKVYLAQSSQELADYIKLVWSIYYKDKLKTAEEYLEIAAEVMTSLKLR